MKENMKCFDSIIKKNILPLEIFHKFSFIFCLKSNYKDFNEFWKFLALSDIPAVSFVKYAKLL